MGKLRVAVVDNHPIFCEGLAHVFGRYADIQLVGQGECAKDAIRIAREQNPDVMVLGMNMSGGGLHAVETITNDTPATKILLLSVETNVEKFVMLIGPPWVVRCEC